MYFSHKLVSFMAVFCVVPAAFAATARPSVLTTASSRMPTMSKYITTSTGTTTTTTGTTTTTALLANAECIDAYTACMKSADTCGENFEECTTKVLFHGKMPLCLSTLAQCNTSGVSSLFGTSNVSALSTVATKNTYGEVTDYTYPTDGSVMGQLITGAAISNRYDTSTCVRRYTSCLKKDSVCGDQFELCTTNTEFRKQRVFCDSTLARCQSDGLIELFGTASATATPSATSRIGELITDGAATAAVNAVSTCYKVVDQCILNACATNPYKCFENSNLATVDIVESINNGTDVATDTTSGTDTVTKSAVAGYIKNACQATIGANKYCYATFLGNGTMPSASQLADEDNQAEVYDAAYSARMNSSMLAQIKTLIEKFDTNAKSKCTDTIRTCAMRVCGSGSGAACYATVFGSTPNSINKTASYNEIKTGCSAIVNTDAYCKYAASNPNSAGTYSYTYINNDAFDTLFPEYETGYADPIGVIASLNASLATNYSDAAIAQMKKQCQSVATSCVKSMCGADYVNCYRNRTDIYSTLTDSGNASYDKSMNKVGGVLDYTIVLGLCLDTVKNASVCEEHLAIETNKLRINGNSSASSWGAGTVRGDWIDAGSATSVTAETETVAATDENGNALCTTKNGSDQGICYTVDASGNVYDQPVSISYTTYIQSQAASTLFKDLIYDLEKEAQAKYNAKLTNEQNRCLAMNNGGIIGNKDTGSTYMWVKLKSNKVPSGYATAGLKSSQFAASNDLYGSFCRLRITVQSDDKQIQDVISKGADWSTAYFAVGDTFTCGSWIPESALNSMAKTATKDAGKSISRNNWWSTGLALLGGGTLGGMLGNNLVSKGQDGKGMLGGLLATTNSNDISHKKDARQCAALLTSPDDFTSVNNGVVKANTLYNAMTEDDDYDAKSQADFKAKIDAVTNAMTAYRTTDKTTENRTDATTAKRDTTAFTNAKKAYTDAVVALRDKCTDNPNQCSGKVAALTVYSEENASAIIDLINTEKGITGDSDCPGKKSTSCSIKQRYPGEAAVVISAVSAINGIPESAREETYTVTEATVTSGANPAYTTAKNNYFTAVEALRTECLTIQESGLSAKKVKDAQKTAANQRLIGTAVGAVAGAGLTVWAVGKLRNQLKTEAEQKAYDEWMEDVGNHIRCYVGSDEAGMYGDIIGTSLD